MQEALKRELRIFVVALLAALAFGAWSLGNLARADEPPQPVANTPALPLAATAGTGAPSVDAGFLDLPAYDVERVDGSGPLKVGDTVTLKLQGLTKQPNQEFKLAVPNGAESITDQGWDVDTESASPGGPAAPGEFRFKATPLKAGHLTLPSLSVADTTGKAIARTNPYDLEIQSAIKADDPKPEQPADLRPPVSLHFPWWVILAGVVLLAALVVGGVYAYRRWRARQAKPVAVAPAEPARPEDEVALAALAELERSGPLKRGEFKVHYFRVSEILKIYIGARYRFEAAESTTREMITRLEEKRALVDQQIDRLETLFEKLDLVKFTDHVPLPDEGLRLVEVAREFVQTTRRPPEVVGQPAGAGPAPLGVSR